MLDGWEERTKVILRQFFSGDNLRIAIVGNGPLHESDRVKIAMASRILRFNDCNNRRDGEKTTLRVVRHPSWFTFQHIGAPIWHVAPTASLLPSDAQLFTPVYERQHAGHNLIGPDARIFPSCDCGPSCLQATTWAGPSTGAVALSVLQEMESVSEIHVFGFNSNGDAKMHIDFANKTLLSGCCTKCTFHPTKGNDYGQNFVATSVGVVSIGAVALVTAAVAGFGVRRAFKRKPSDAKRPLLNLGVPAQ